MSAAIRPSFALDLDCPSKVVLERLFARLSAGPHQLRRTRAFGSDRAAEGRDRDHFILTVAEQDQHLWSPWLNVEVKPRKGGAYLFARFGPHPSVWTGFAFCYLGLTLGLLLALSFSAALSMSGGSPWTLWLAGAIALAMLGLWGVSLAGQRLAREEMSELRAEFDAALRACGTVTEAP